MTDLSLLRNYTKRLLHAAQLVLEVDEKLSRGGVDEIELREARSALKAVVKEGSRILENQ